MEKEVTTRMKKVHGIMNAVHGVFVALAIMCASAFSAFADSTFTIEDGVLTAVELNGATKIVIPSGVTSIGEGAFDGCSGLTNVIIGVGVTNIGAFAFYDCTGLTSVAIPDSVISIGDWALSECSGLTSVTIGDGVMSIGSGAFSSCSGLTSVTIPNSVTNIENYAFADCRNLSEVVFLDDMSEIDMDVASVFEGSWWLLEYMGAEEIDGATGSVTRLVEANVEDEMYSYYDDKVKWYKWTAPKSGFMTVQVEDSDYKTALDGCCYDVDGSWITDFGTEVEKVDSSEYRYTGHLEFYVEKGVTCYFAAINFGVRRELTLAWNCIDAVYEFEYEDNDDGTVTLTGVSVREAYDDWELVIPSEIDGKTVVAISSGVFSGLVMASVTISDGLTYIGDYAFAGCGYLTSITIPDSVTSIGGGGVSGVRLFD